VGIIVKIDMPKQRHIELRSAGFEEGNQLCPDCGCVLYMRENTIRIGSDEWEEMYETESECPCCGYQGGRSYDA